MNKILLFFLTIILTIICIYSCKPIVKKLGANPKVSYYMVGRLKTTEVSNGLPFKVEVFSLNPQLIEKPIGIRIENLENFSLLYSFDGRKEKKECTFGKEINNNNMRLLINKAISLDSITCETLKNLDYQFQVKGEE